MFFGIAAHVSKLSTEEMIKNLILQYFKFLEVGDYG